MRSISYPAKFRFVYMTATAALHIHTHMHARARVGVYVRCLPCDYVNEMPIAVCVCVRMCVSEDQFTNSYHNYR